MNEEGTLKLSGGEGADMAGNSFYGRHKTVSQAKPFSGD